MDATRTRPSVPRTMPRLSATTFSPVRLMPAGRHPGGLPAEVIGRALAAGMLLFAAPVIALAVLAVKCSSRGPGIYTQTRLGRAGRTFTIYKIRTMRIDAEAGTGAVWAQKNDPRVTRLGKILRTLHIDELPQLWNVLRGEMRLVGPRPERPAIANKLRLVIPNYDGRLAVKPGLTGLAQIHLPPDETVRSVRRKLGYDLAYVRTAGAWLDAKILACTALKVLGLKRLYQRA
jgi:lipopolysaccharide/colanic/teichoic acid biosynthesis glycosyltransferase